MLTFGLEVETYGKNKELVNRALIDNGIKGCIVKPDGTPNVDCEIVLPPLALCDFSFDYIKKVCRVLESIGCRINRQCGLHVHISNAQALRTNPTDLSSRSIQYTERTGRFIGGSEFFGDPMDAVAVKDIMIRYARSQATINSMFPRSRTSNRYCATMHLDGLNSSRTIEQLRDATVGKFSVINLNHWRNGTIEFRQASGTIEADKIINWVLFLINLVHHTIENRIENGQSSETISTPLGSVWANLPDDIFEWWQNRITELSRS